LPRDGTLVFTGGHVHPGGLWTDLDVGAPGRGGEHAEGASALHARAPQPGAPRPPAGAATRAGACVRRPAPAGPIPGHEPGSVRLWRSDANYFDPAGPVSWDLAMRRTPSDWRVGLKKGDRLVESATYNTSRASWYESMGINVSYISYGEQGPDPFRQALDQRGTLSHGHLRRERQPRRPDAPRERGPDHAAGRPDDRKRRGG